MTDLRADLEQLADDMAYDVTDAPARIRAVLAKHPADSVQISMVDIAAEAREMYGEHADEVAGRKLPEHEWRFELLFSDGARASMHFGATADDIKAYLDHLKRERS